MRLRNFTDRLEEQSNYIKAQQQHIQALESQLAEAVGLLEKCKESLSKIGYVESWSALIEQAEYHGHTHRANKTMAALKELNKQFRDNRAEIDAFLAKHREGKA